MSAFQQSDHIVVLSHGIMGSSTDLTVLDSLLKSKGCLVLNSTVNEGLKTFCGIRCGGKSLADEILNFVGSYPQARRISFVGNSLGGLYVRYAIKDLYDEESNSIAGLEPYCMVSIGTPHLGVCNKTILSDLGIKGTQTLEVIISSLMLSTGYDLFENEVGGLLHLMATKGEFLNPLRAFRKRILYANVIRDLVVPLETGGIMTKEEVRDVKALITNESGMTILNTGRKDDYQRQSISTKLNNFNSEMISQLNNCGWIKVLVKFAGNFPTAHDQLCAMTKYGKWIDTLLGYREGEYVMEHVAEQLAPEATDA